MEWNPEEKQHKRNIFSFNNCLRATTITIMRGFYCHIVIILRSYYDIIMAQHNKYPDLKNCAALPVVYRLWGPFKIESSIIFVCLNLSLYVQYPFAFIVKHAETWFNMRRELSYRCHTCTNTYISIYWMQLISGGKYLFLICLLHDEWTAMLIVSMWWSGACRVYTRWPPSGIEMIRSDTRATRFIR